MIVHEHCGEAGAIGAALEAGRLWDNGRKTTLHRPGRRAQHIQYKTTRNEATRCYFCKNKCLRTFIDVKTNLINLDYKPPVKTKVPLEAGAQRLIIATCEKGTVENIEDMRGIKGDLDKIKKANPNFVEIAAKAVFRVPDVPLVADAPPKFQITARAEEARRADEEARRDPHRHAARAQHVLADAGVHRLFRVARHSAAEHRLLRTSPARSCTRKAPSAAPSTRCFPSKLGIPHVHNLLYKAHAKKPLDIIFFPMIDCLTSDLHKVQASRAPAPPWPPRPRP